MHEKSSSHIHIKLTFYGCLFGVHVCTSLQLFWINYFELLVIYGWTVGD